MGTINPAALSRSLRSLRERGEVVEPAAVCCNVCTCICCRKVFPQRYCMTIMLITGLTILYMQRVGINLAIVDMVLPVDASYVKPLCPSPFETTNTSEAKINDEQYDWDEQEQSYILLSFYLGYLVGNAFAGYFTDEYGARWFLFGGVLLSTVTTAIVPPIAYYTHWLGIVAARILAGLGQSTFFPGATSLIARWIPEEQKSSIAAIVMTSFTLGTVAGNVFTGYIILWTNTWCWVYYIYGILGAIWLMLFYFFVFSDPNSHPRVSQNERETLSSIKKHEHQKLPALRMFTDTAVWCLLIAQFGNDYTLYIIMTNMPKYFTTVLNVSTQMTGTLLMGPPLACFVGSLVFGFAADYMVGKWGMRKVKYRIIATIMAIPLSCISMLLMTTLQCNLIGAISMLCLAMFLKAGFFAGAGVMGIDISEKYSGILIGLGAMAGGLAGMVAPYIIGMIATDNTFPQWMLIHYVTLAISVACLIPYLLFAKDYRKDWDYGPDETNPNPPVPPCKRVWVWYKPAIEN